MHVRSGASAVVALLRTARIMCAGEDVGTYRPVE